MMATPSPRYPDNRDWLAQAGSGISELDQGHNGTIESPEMLRWRADMLLDEMMLGGVDVADGNHQHNRNGQGNGMGNSYANGHAPTSTLANGSYANGTSAPSSTMQPHPTQNYSTQPVNGYTNGTEYPRQEAQQQNVGYPAANHQASTYPAANHLQPVAVDVTTPVLVSAEQRYANLGRGRISQPMPALQVTPQVNGHYSSTQPIAGAETSPYVRSNQPQTSTTENGQSAALGPMRRVDVAGVMAVANRGSKYSTLLPRESTSDPDVLLREIVSLRDQVAAVMPIGHETRERAQKLLEKAHSILQGDPLRSAEVEYYLQQVRAMIERVKQSFDYSTLYRSRLIAYLFAWITLALIVITGCLLYGQNLVNLLASITSGSSDSFGFKHLVALILTLFAGALGGTVCAFWSIQRHAKREYGFFDRKFSLRNLVFPLSGFVASLIIYLVFALLYWGMRLDPSQSLWLAFLPMLVVFALASSQEMLFSVRD